MSYCVNREKNLSNGAKDNTAVLPWAVRIELTFNWSVQVST